MTNPFGGWIKPLRAVDVFTPGSFPAYTYVAREGEVLEQTLRDAVETPGQIVSLVGPSKSGKTVLVEKVVGIENLITITGAGIESPDIIWHRICDALNVPISHTAAKSTTKKKNADVEAGGTVSVFGFAGGQAKTKGSLGVDDQSGSTMLTHRRGLEDVVALIAGTDKAILIDDFHYMPRDVQSESAKSLKEAVRRGVKIITAAVMHRGDDLVRANPELRGRVRSIDLKYWSHDDLKLIAV